MGTNFHWHDTPCESCGRFDVLHVGKQSAGWSFGFRGYRHDPEDGIYSPVGYPVRSRADWRRVFTTRPGSLFDEYGKQMDDPVAWLDSLTAPTPEQQFSEDSPERRGPYALPPSDPHEWRDGEGFRFYDGEFS